MPFESSPTAPGSRQPPLGLVFDKDGTLIDGDARWFPFARDIVVAAAAGDRGLERRLADALGVGRDRLVPNGPAEVASFAELAVIAGAELAAAGLDPEASQDRFARASASARLGPLRAIGDVRRALSTLAAAGLPLAVATTDDRSTATVDLAALEIEALLDAVLCGDDDGPVKPDPEVLTGLARAWGHPIERLWMIGDSIRDQATATAAGAGFVVVAPGGTRPSWATDAVGVVASVDELPAMVGIDPERP
ncbi:MAG: HAD family hydrolase [Actinomycetota bacterium]